MRAVVFAARAVLLIALIALAAEVFGYSRLAHLMARSVTTALYGAVILYGAVRVADELMTVALRTRPLDRLQMVRRWNRLIHQRTMAIVRVLAWAGWAVAVLSSGEALVAVRGTVDSVLAARLPLPEVAITIGDLTASVLTFWSALFLSRFIRFCLEEDVYPRIHLAKGRPYATSTLLHYIILTIGFFLAALALGFDINRFTLLAGAFGVGIGFGLQSIVNNFVSGIILLTERPVEVGDTISLGDVFGSVERIGLRSSTVRTWQGAEIILPNADLITQQVTNWTLSDRRRRMEIPIGVAYGTEPRRAMKVLAEAARGVEEILSTPEPHVLFLGFGDSSLDFEIRAWTDQFDEFWHVRSEVCLAVSEALDKARIEIPFPQRDLHVRTIIERASPGSPQPHDE